MNNNTINTDMKNTILNAADKNTELCLSYSPLKNCFIANTNKEYLENVADFDREYWPNFEAMDLVSIVKDYYKHYCKEIL